jgi:hypothetical protein
VKDRRAAKRWPEEVRRGLVGAGNLAAHLARGGAPQVLTAAIPLFQGEQLYAMQPFSLAEFAGRTVPYNQFWFGVGSPMMFTATLGLSALMNHSRKVQAQAEAAARWRPINHGTLYLTNQRFGLHGMFGWNDIHYRAIRNSYLVPLDGIVVFLDGSNPLKVNLPWPEYHFLLFQFLAYGTVVPFELPPELRAAPEPLPDNRLLERGTPPA